MKGSCFAIFSNRDMAYHAPLSAPVHRDKNAMNGAQLILPTSALGFGAVALLVLLA